MEQSLDVADHHGADDRRGQESHDQIAREQKLGTVACESAPYKLPETGAEYPHHGKDGAELDDDFENLVVAGVEIYPVADQQ